MSVFFCGGSYSEEIVDMVKGHCNYIRANRCSDFYEDMFILRGWKIEEINGIEIELNSMVVVKWKGNRTDLLFRDKEGVTICRKYGKASTLTDVSIPMTSNQT